MNRLIIIGYEHHNTLGAIRASYDIKDEKWLIVIAPQKSKRYVEFSRYIKRSNVIQINDESKLITTLKSFPLNNDNTIILSCGDKITHLLDINKSNLPSNFVLPIINAKIGKVSSLQDKNEMNRIVSKYDVRIPYSKNISRTDNLNIVDNCKFPCFIKAASSCDGPKDLTIYKTREELLKGIQSLHKVCKDIQIQEYIEKDKEILILGYADGKGGCALSCVLDKYRQCPPKVGGSTYCYVSPYIEDYIEPKILKQIIIDSGYNGLFSFEFLIKDKQAYFLEINFRNDAMGFAPTGGNVNQLKLWYDSNINGTRITEQRVKDSYMLMSDINDISNILNKEVSLSSWIKQFITAKVKLLWSIKDPAPFFIYFFNRIFRR